MGHPGFPPGRVIGETFHLPGAHLAMGPNEPFGEQTVADDEITSLEILRNECGVFLEGWVSIPRLGQRYLRYLAF